jgi:hypothetical protein
VVLSWRGTPIQDRLFVGEGAVTVGEGPTSTFVLPGVGESAQTLLRGDCLDPVASLDGVVERAWGRQPFGGDSVRLFPGESARLVLREHPDVKLSIRREPVEQVSFGRRVGSTMVRELLYGLSFAVCLLALLSIERPTSAAIARGEPDVGSLRVARFMFEGPGAPATSPFAAPVLPAPRPGEDLEADAVVPGSEPEAKAPPKPVRGSPRPRSEKKTSRARGASKPAGDRGSSRAGGGRSSHAADGQHAAKGRPDGTAAVDGKRRCVDPVSAKKDHVDVVFVIDVSTTMGFVLDKLAAEIEAMDREVRKHDQEPRYGLVVFVDDVMVANGGKPFASIAALRAEFQRWAAFVSTNRQIHAPAPNMDWPENSLDALYLAATRFEWRPAEDTLRLVVHATDDDFGESGVVQSGQPVRHTYRGTVKALKRAGVRVATFAAHIGGQCECLDVSPGWFTAYKGQPSIPDATGGAAFDIDEVALGRLALSDAVAATVESTVCTEYLAPWQ